MVAERLAARGVSAAAAEAAGQAVATVLSKGGGGPNNDDGDASSADAKPAKLAKVAVLAISGEEYDGLAEVAKRQLDAGTPTAKLAKALEKDLKKVLGGGAMSVDAKLFGRMVSGVPEARSTGCLGNTAAVGSHAVEDFLDTFVAVDRHAPIEHGSGAGHFDEKHRTGSVFVADWWLDEKLARDRDHEIDPEGTVEGLVRGFAGLVIRPLSGKTAVPLETIELAVERHRHGSFGPLGGGVPVARRPRRHGRGRDAAGLAGAPRPPSWWAGLAALAGRGRPRPAAGYGARRAPTGGVIGTPCRAPWFISRPRLATCLAARGRPARERPCPARSTLAGILGAAMGIDRGETERLARLAAELRWGVAVLDRGEMPIGVRGPGLRRSVAGSGTRPAGVGAGGEFGPKDPNRATPTSLRVRPLRAGLRLVLALDGSDWCMALRAPRWPLALGSRASLRRPLRCQRVARSLDHVLARLARMGLEVWAPVARHGVTVWSRGGTADIYARSNRRDRVRPDLGGRDPWVGAAWRREAGRLRRRHAAGPA